MTQALYSIDCFKDTAKFSLRYGVMWQDVLSLSNFSLKHHIAQSTGIELIELIGTTELIEVVEPIQLIMKFCRIELN